MNTSAVKRIQINGKGGNKRLSFTGLHLGNIAFMKNDPTHYLDIKMSHVQPAPGDFAHNGECLGKDLIQVFAFGANGGALNGRGHGNTPEHVGSLGIGYGSPVAGPDSWYQLEATYDASLGALGVASIVASETVGPWRRIRTTGGEIGRRGEGDGVPVFRQGAVRAKPAD